MAKKILITGSGGFVGKNLYQMLQSDYDILGVGKTKKEYVDEGCDITDSEKLIGILNRFSPEVIVHLAALSNVERCEIEQDFAYEQNVKPAKILVDWADLNNARIVYVSTDYVYDGVKGNFTELDPENPIQHYGRTKLEAEKIISKLSNHLVLRPTVIYGWDQVGMNFFMQLYRNQKEGRIMKVPMDQISNPTYVQDFCRLVKTALESDLVGVFIATGPESMSRYEFALKICAQMNFNSSLVIPVDTKSLGQIALRPLNNSTSSKKVCDLLQFHFSNLENINLSNFLQSAEQI
ncbi:MAG: SDR family oxidoreductase [Candidatus Falkowbacteria bacterium]